MFKHIIYKPPFIHLSSDKKYEYLYNINLLILTYSQKQKNDF